MGDDIGHECGFAMLRLLKPPQYYLDKYGTHFFGLNRMYMMLEKSRHRGQDGCGVASVTLDVPPGSQYIHCEKSIAADSIKDRSRCAPQCSPPHATRRGICRHRLGPRPSQRLSDFASAPGDASDLGYGDLSLQ